jgi:tryptophanyl-tRNA synthetase
MAAFLTVSVAPARRIMSLTDPTKKMSKSDPNPNSRILITDDEETIHLKFKTALTDSLEDITYDPENRPGVSNLLDILKHIKDDEISSNDLAAAFRASSLRVLKETVAGAVVERLREVREKYLQLRSRPKSLEMGLRQNQAQVTSSATGTIKEVRRALGLRDFSGKTTTKSHSFKPTEE